ncbi:hypothetical protein HER10_EVM0010933 [Colletotrichum scovillei]|uniref:uncharacterized protein n=1 Tax=Colletotrichum scovillei TaxID=1209932 RepID=UPI0015C3744C|nr:uncharacterized protein HER10_EVM0010933 [Colletotrichum scovillei]KAF4778821.1 hypothetical protein HER10_EVM0010933 [Colletotrichum scovillei]
MSTYPYRPLSLPNETRILTVQPGNLDDKIICSISHLNLDSPDEPYEALSYCWSKSIDAVKEIDPDTDIPWAIHGLDDYGNTISESGTSKWKDLCDHPYYGEQYIRLGGRMPDHPIECDGVEIVVGGELFRALRRMRSKDGGEPLRIWVDALCINQQDLKERNEHVKVMGRVYAGALRTRVVDLASATMHEIQWHFHNNADTNRLEWGLLADLLNRSWFKRTWIIQEVVNSREVIVHLGTIQVPWHFLAIVIDAMSEFKLQSMISECKGFKAIGFMEQLRKERVDKAATGTSTPLLTLLEELRDFQATIPSDKIYGVLGLIDQRGAYVVDYAQTPGQVFTDFAIKSIRDGSLDILTHCVDSSKPTSLKLPSWVPDWTRPGWTEPLRIRGLEASAAGDSKPSLHIDEDAGVLHIKGRIVDVVAQVESKRQIPVPNQQGSLGGMGENKEVGKGSVGNGADTSGSNAIKMAKYGGAILKHERENEKEAGVGGSIAGHDTERSGSPINDAEYRLNETMEKMAKHSEEWYRSLIDVAFPDKTATPETWENLWRTFMCNRTRDNNERPGEDCATGFEVHYKTALEPGKGLARVLQERTDHQIESHGLAPQDGVAHYMKEKEAAERFIGAHTKWTYNRRFFRSKGGRFGWAVDGVKEGDLVVVLYGCDYPIIIREGEQKKSRIIGDCYIHGLMDGEAMEESLAFAETEFEIV